MIERVIQSCLRHRFLVLIALAGLVAYGVYASMKLQVDAFPDVTNVQVQVYTTWPGMSPEEVEKQVTFPIEVQLAGLPDMTELRSVSRFGFSLIGRLKGLCAFRWKGLIPGVLCSRRIIKLSCTAPDLMNLPAPGRRAN